MNIFVNKDGKTEDKTEFIELESRLMAGQVEYQNIPVPKEMKERLQEAVGKAKRVRKFHVPVAIAAAIVIIILLPNMEKNIAYAMSNIPVVGKLFQAVTFRDYQYESERFEANVEVPQIIVEDIEFDKEGAEEHSQNLQKTIEKVNFDIERVTNQLIEEFKESAELGESYGGLEIHHEIVTDNERYFALKLSIYQGAGSGTESYKLYTIDKQIGQQVQIGDLFQKDSNYNELISENIREQMRAAMEADEGKVYWVDYMDVPEWNWQGLKEDQNFYFDKEENLVVVFDEYEVAPGYMGAQEFVVEKVVFEELLK